MIRYMHILTCLTLVLFLSFFAFQAQATQLLRQPSVNQDTLVFAYANDIWQVNLNGGEAKRLTSFQGSESDPKLSPNGDWIAFTGQYAGNADIYIVKSDGSQMKRLTYHPGNDVAVGWTPDGQSVLFSSTRSNAPRSWERLFTVSNDQGTPEALPMNRAFNGAFSDDGSSLVFRRAGYWDKGWRNYRGGQNQALRVINLSSLEESDLPFENDFDIDPVYSGNYIYFLSNRSQVANVFRYNTTNREIEQVTRSRDFDVMSFAVDDDTLVYEYMGDLYRKKGQADAEKIDIRINGDFYWLREQFVDASKTLGGFGISPNGKRAVFEARGDIFTVPVEFGSPRNLNDSSASREVSPAWSPNGQTIAYFSDASGEYRLVIAEQKGAVKQEITLAESGFYQNLKWSPDNNRLIFSDSRQQLWIVNVGNGSSRIIDKNTQVHVEPDMMASWSPDSKWVAYTTQNANMFRELHLYSVEKRESYKITDGLAEVRYPVWDAAGDKLYFAASTDYGPHSAWLDMSTLAFTPNYHLYYMLLNKDATLPLALRSDEEAVDESDNDKPAEEKPETELANVIIDLDYLSDAIMPLMGDSGQFSDLKAGKAGELFYISSYQDVNGNETSELMRYSLSDRSAKSIAKGVQAYTVSANKESVLINTGSWHVFAASGESGGDDNQLNMALKKRINYAQEWQQIFREAWRYQRDYLYVDNFHGADWDAIYQAYQPLVASVRHPSDLTYLLDALGAETSVGHSFTGEGELPEIDSNQVGLLGADFEVDKKGVRISKVFTGKRYFPAQNMSAPLAQVAHKIAPDSYLLSVNGKAVEPETNVFSYFKGTLGQVTEISIGRSADDKNPQRFLVEPIASEYALRRNEWAERNREYVDKASDGKLAYVWIPDTGDGGFESFNRYFFSQAHKPGIVLDERFNQGGLIANYIISNLRRELNGFFNNPFDQSQPMTSPGIGVWGSKVMLINEVSGSGGDMLPYLFRHFELGKLVGKRTWGGLVGIWGVPPFVDGGAMTAPRSGFYNLNGEWKVENEGIAPDIDVEQWTKETIQGKDPQLDRAIAEALKELEDYQSPIKPQPAPPVRVPQV